MGILGRLRHAATALSVSLVLAGPASADVVRIGVAPKNTLSYEIATKAASAASRDGRSRGGPHATDFAVVETGGTVDNVRRLDRGQVDAALVSLKTLRTDTSETVRDLRVLEFLFVAPQVLYATEESGITSLAQLDGRPVIAGNAGSGTERTTMEVFAVLGIHPRWVRMASDQIPGAIRSGEAVAFVESMGNARSAAFVDAIAAYRPLRQLGVPTSRQAVLRQRMPSLRLVGFGTVPGTMAWADPMAIAATSVMSDADAARYAKALREARDAMGLGAEGFGPKELPDVRFHPGVLAAGDDDRARVPRPPYVPDGAPGATDPHMAGVGVPG